MEKNKRTLLVVLFVIGIGICTWSIYNSIMTMSKGSDNTAAEQTGKSNNTQNTGKTGTPTVIGNNSNANDKDADDDSDTDTDDSEKDTNGKTQNGNTQTANTDANKYMNYTIKEGETLKDICAKYADKCPSTILSKAILTANNLKTSSDVKAGMEIKIPEKYISGGIKYTVKSGDSLSFIATKYMKDIKLADAIKALSADNFLTSDSIRVGDQLFVETSDKNASSTSAGDDTNKEESTSTMGTINNRVGDLQEYTVKEGETLAAISKKYSETCPEKTASSIILKINGLTKSTDIKAGTKVKLPDQYLSKGEVYTVEEGDTLYDIVSKNMPDIPVNEGIKIISEDNGIKDSVIMPGQKLFVASISKQ